MVQFSSSTLKGDQLNYAMGVNHQESQRGNSERIRADIRTWSAYITCALAIWRLDGCD